jgi:hypothetical protein
LTYNAAKAHQSPTPHHAKPLVVLSSKTEIISLDSGESDKNRAGSGHDTHEKSDLDDERLGPGYPLEIHIREGGGQPFCRFRGVFSRPGVRRIGSRFLGPATGEQSQQRIPVVVKRARRPPDFGAAGFAIP